MYRASWEGRMESQEDWVCWPRRAMCIMDHFKAGQDGEDTEEKEDALQELLCICSSDSAFLPRSYMLWPRLTLFFSTRPAVWYRTGPAKCTTTKLGSRLSLLWPRQGLPASVLSMRVCSCAALLGRLRRHSCGMGAGSHHSDEDFPRPQHPQCLDSW